MAKSNALDAVKFQRQFLLLTGLWPEKEETLWKKVRWLISHLISVFYIVMTTIELFHHLDDYKVLSDHLSIMTSPTSFFIKLLLFELNKDKFLDLLELISHRDSFHSHPDELEVHMQNMIKLCSLIAKMYFGFCGIVILLYCTMPLMGAVVSLPVRFSYELSFWFYPMYVYQVLALWSIAANNACLDILAASFIGIAAAQLDILKFKILHFADARPDDNATAPDNEPEEHRSPGTTLHQCVDHHNDIMRYVSMIEGVFSLLFLAQFLTSIIVICNIGFQLAHVSRNEITERTPNNLTHEKNPPLSLQFAKMLSYFFAMMLQLGMYCWFGNEVSLKGAAIGDACFESKWIDCRLHIRRSLTIIIQRCSKPLRLTAGNYSTLSLASFAAVINSSYTYFALMQRLYKDSSE